jgi:hypothetical protein
MAHEIKREDVLEMFLPILRVFPSPISPPVNAYELLIQYFHSNAIIGVLAAKLSVIPGLP